VSESSNKAIVQSIFAALATGNRQPFADAMAEDFSWTISGRGPWARTWHGKRAVQTGLMAPLFAQFSDTYRNQATRVLCDGDTAVVERRGSVTTRAGAHYDNQYCYVIDFADGKMRALTEYMDTALAEAVLSPPA
jgi:uncharacterized protein